MTVIRAAGLEKSFSSVEALRGLDFDVARGELFGFLGPNGAGKTTTIRILTGQLVPDAGSVCVLDTDPTAKPIETRRRVGILPEDGSPPSFLTPREYFRFVGNVRGLGPELVAERVDAWADRLGYAEKLDTLHTDLSRGQQQKVMITQAFLHEPAVVFIDEPLANLDPLVQEGVKRILVSYAREGNAVFVSTHNIDVAADVCTRVGILAAGRLVGQFDVEGMDGESLLEEFMARVDDAGHRDPPMNRGSL